jgi:hypothetical protein
VNKRRQFFGGIGLLWNWSVWRESQRILIDLLLLLCGALSRLSLFFKKIFFRVNRGIGHAVAKKPVLYFEDDTRDSEHGRKNALRNKGMLLVKGMTRGYLCEETATDSGGPKSFAVAEMKTT